MNYDCRDMAMTDLPKRTVRSPVVLRQTYWLAAGLIIGFLVPFVLADTLHLPRDLYYGIYALIVAAFITLWAHDTEQPLADMIHRRWKLAVVLGIVCAAVLALVVV
ncbi:MAG TPA: hypothetical protein VFN75_11805, partial [Pseudonocardiaceae bacterium]|nr:hypothetical protein [Pseudonocardiaceae bacterium]